MPPDPLALPFHPAAPDGTFGKSRPKDHLSGELPPLEGLILPHLSRLSLFRHGMACNWARLRRKAATERTDRQNRRTNRVKLFVLVEVVDLHVSPQCDWCRLNALIWSFPLAPPSMAPR